MLAVKFYCGVGFHAAILQLLADSTQDESDCDLQGRVDNVDVFRNWIRSGENRSSRKSVGEPWALIPRRREPDRIPKTVLRRLFSRRLPRQCRINHG